MAAYGSPEYSRAWKWWDMPLGRRICALRASERPISDNGSGGLPAGWGTPRSAETGHSSGSPERGADRKARLEDQVHGAEGRLAGWGTLTASSKKRSRAHASGRNMNPAEAGGWPTATVPSGTRGLQRDPEAALRRRAAGQMLNLDDAVLLGITPKGWPTVMVPNGGRSVATAERVGGTYYFGDRKTQVDLAGLVRVVTPAGWTTPAASEPLSPNPRPSREATGRTTEYLGRQVHQAMPAGWSTPTAMDGRRGGAPPRPHDSGHPLSQQVAGWPTVTANDDNKSPEAHLAMKERMGGNRKAITSLSVMAKAQASGWPTVQARDWKDGACSESRNPQDARPGGMMLGETVSLSRAETGAGGVLNPAFACWLMGYPLAFVLVLSEGWETRSSRL